MKNKNLGCRLILYTIGMVTLALGLTLTAETDLGTSPLMSIPFVFGAITGISFPDAALGMFILMVIAQMLIKREKKAMVGFLLQIPLSIVFTRVMRIAQDAIDISGCSLAPRFAILLLAVVLTGIGAVLGLRMRLVPNPGDGLVQTLAERLGLPLGTVKNGLDIPFVILASILSLVFLHRLVGVGIGSVVAMVGVGRVMMVVNWLCDRFGIPRY
ncbi:MAG: DUF6198 family protein [Faecousia sp.]